MSTDKAADVTQQWQLKAQTEQWGNIFQTVQPPSESTITTSLRTYNL